MKKNICEFTSISVGGNMKYHPEKGCILSFYNEDDAGNETDTVGVRLTPAQIKTLSKMLQDFIIE